MADDPNAPAGQPPAPDGTAAPAATPAAPAPAKPWRNPRAAAAAKPAPAAEAAPAATPVEAPKPGAVKIPGRIAKELEQLRAQGATYKTTAKQLETAHAALGEYAQRELSGLSEAQRAYVLKHAGKDPTRQLAMAADLRAMAPAAAPPSPAVKPIASTAPPSAPNPGASNDPDVAAFQQYETMKAKRQHSLAAAHLSKNYAAIKRGESKAAARN